MNSMIGDDKISSTMDRIKDLGSFHGFFINDEHVVKFQKRAQEGSNASLSLFI
jgi:hypothetical protein